MTLRPGIPRSSLGKVLRGPLGAIPLSIGKHRAWVGSEFTYETGPVRDLSQLDRVVAAQRISRGGQSRGVFSSNCGRNGCSGPYMRPRSLGRGEAFSFPLQVPITRHFLFTRNKGEEGDGFRERSRLSGIGPAMSRSAAGRSSVRGQRAASPMGR